MTTLVKTDRSRPIDVVIDSFGVTRGTAAELRPAAIEPVHGAGASR